MCNYDFASVLSICRQRPVNTECVAGMMNSAIGASGHFTCSVSGRCCWRLLLPRNWSERSVTIRAASGRCVLSLCRACFFVILRPAWFLSSCLDFAWYLGSSLVLLGSCLWCWSSDHHVAFVQVSSCILLNYKTITCKFISQFGYVAHQTPKSKVNGPRVYFPYNLPLFGDWWQHDQSKQIIKILNLENYLLARIQCIRARLYDAKWYHL